MKPGNHSESVGNCSTSASAATGVSTKSPTPRKICDSATPFSSGQYEQVHAHRRADEPNLHDKNDQDAELHRVETQADDVRKEHWNGQEHHRELLHDGAEHHIDHHHRSHHHQRTQALLKDSFLQVQRHGREVEEGREQHRRGACAFHQHPVENLQAECAPSQREEK